MGSTLSREEKRKKKERKSKAYHPKKIYYDVDGNLRHDWDRPPRNKNDELIRIMQEEAAMEEADEELMAAAKAKEKKPRLKSANAQPVQEEEGDSDDESKLYYVVSSPWINAWVAFAYASKTSPDPGPCCNDVLLMRDEEGKRYVPQDAVTLTRKGRRGDYRHITEGTWKQICSLYPGSGPAIKVNFKKDPKHISDGLYDTSEWEIDQSSFKPQDENKGWLRKKIKKTEEKKEVVVVEPSNIVSADDIDMSMEDKKHTVDPRTTELLGNQASVLYDNPMKKKRDTPANAVKNTNRTTSVPNEELHQDESNWLFH